MRDDDPVLGALHHHMHHHTSVAVAVHAAEYLVCQRGWRIPRTTTAGKVTAMLDTERRYHFTLHRDLACLN